MDKVGISAQNVRIVYLFLLAAFLQETDKLLNLIKIYFDFPVMRWIPCLTKDFFYPTGHYK